MAAGLREFNQWSSAGAPLLNGENGEKLMHAQPGVSIVLDGRSPEHQGTLYISTKRVIWLSDVDRNKGYAVDFLSLYLHEQMALKCTPFLAYTPSLDEGNANLAFELQQWSRTMIRRSGGVGHSFVAVYIETDEQSDGTDAEHVDALNLSRVKEMRLIPSDPEQLGTLFEIFCECTELNPEPSDEEESGEHNWVFSANMINNDADEGEDPAWDASANMGSAIGHSNGDHDLAPNVLELHINDHLSRSGLLFKCIIGYILVGIVWLNHLAFLN